MRGATNRRVVQGQFPPSGNNASSEKLGEVCGWRRRSPTHLPRLIEKIQNDGQNRKEGV